MKAEMRDELGYNFRTFLSSINGYLEFVAVYIQFFHPLFLLNFVCMIKLSPSAVSRPMLLLIS